MEIVFQNKQEDRQAFYHYMLTQTKEGKQLGWQIFRKSLLWDLLLSLLFGSFVWAIYRNWQFGIAGAIVIFIGRQIMTFFTSGFKPIYQMGLRYFTLQEKSISEKELKVFQLPRTLRFDDDWLEVISSETQHRWRWSRVDRIDLTTNFIFIHADSSHLLFVPRRDFENEESFIEFGKTIIALQERNHKSFQNN